MQNCKPVKGSKQISVNSTSKIKKQVLTPAIINVLKVTPILACGAVSSAIAGDYYYEKGYQAERDDNWLSVGNIKVGLSKIITYYFMFKIGGGIVKSILGLRNAIADQSNAIAGLENAIDGPIFALTLSFSTNLYVSANYKASENVISVSEVQNNKNKSSYFVATLVAVTSTIATARIAYIRGVKNGKADYWLNDENVKAAFSSAWNWTSENVPYAASSAWNWTYCKIFNCEESSAE